MDVTVFTDKGKDPQLGTVEVWNAGKSRRVTVDFGVAKLTRLTTEDGVYRSTTDQDVPYLAMELLERELSTGPASADLLHPFVVTQSHAFGKLKLQCIMLTPTPELKDASLGLFPTYCLLPGSDRLAILYDVGDEAIVVRQEGTFLARETPLKLEIVEKNITVATSAVTLLKTYEPKPDDFLPTPDMTKGSEIARLSGGVIAATRLNFVQPVYPDKAKHLHLSGTVVMRAVIDRQGYVRSLRPTSTSAPDFIEAAVAAVKQWTYRPYLLNGEPTEVDTTITVNFQLGPKP